MQLYNDNIGSSWWASGRPKYYCRYNFFVDVQWWDAQIIHRKQPPNDVLELQLRCVLYSLCKAYVFLVFHGIAKKDSMYFLS